MKREELGKEKTIKIYHRVKKLQINQSVEISELTMVYWLTATLWVVCNFLTLWEPQILDAMISDRFEKVENKMRVTMTNLRIFQSKYLNIWISVAPNTTSSWNVKVNSDTRYSLGKRQSKYKNKYQAGTIPVHLNDQPRPVGQ